MARRGASAGRATRGRGRARDADLEVVDEATTSGPKPGFEEALIFGAFVALLVALVLIQWELAGTYDAGWFGG